jgi:hypothetical protein
MKNRIAIKLNDGKEIVAELYNYDGNHPEIVVCIQENGMAIQDICLVRPHEENDVRNGDVDCFIWADEYSEDYTDNFIIPQYIEEEEQCQTQSI